MSDGTRLVPSLNNSLVEVGCDNAKKDFLVYEHMLGVISNHAASSGKLGSITLVGAGPGDPDLLTLGALKAIHAADLVIADRLVSKEILALIKSELKIAQKYPGCAHDAQNEIYRWCAEGLVEGKKIVRLKIGDPFVFGRGGEEVLELRKFGVEAKVIPGISSALAGPLAAGIPVTHRGVANRVVFCTGMGKEESIPDIPAYHPEQTCVFLMAVGRLKALTDDLTKGGYPSTTPVGIIERATTPHERTIRGTIEDIVILASEEKIRPPSVIVVGEAVNVLSKQEKHHQTIIPFRRSAMSLESLSKACEPSGEGSES